MNQHTHQSSRFASPTAIAATLVVLIACVAPSYSLDPPPLTPLAEFFVFNSDGIPEIPDDWRPPATPKDFGERAE
jgi:hypothetical protein